MSQLCVFGNVQVTTQALHECLKRGVPVCYFSYGGYFQGMTEGFTHKNIELRLAQFRTAESAEKSLQLAKAFIRGKILNSRTMLRRHLVRRVCWASKERQLGCTFKVSRNL
jgi:CRISPR-associated protein Cas1